LCASAQAGSYVTGGKPRKRRGGIGVRVAEWVWYRIASNVYGDNMADYLMRCRYRMKLFDEAEKAKWERRERITVLVAQAAAGGVILGAITAALLREFA
jgi:hypothetical protein